MVFEKVSDQSLTEFNRDIADLEEAHVPQRAGSVAGES